MLRTPPVRPDYYRIAAGYCAADPGIADLFAVVAGTPDDVLG